MVGGSVPSARAPIVSMMRLTQSIITAFRGGSYPLTALKNVMVSATTSHFFCRGVVYTCRTREGQRESTDGDEGGQTDDQVGRQDEDENDKKDPKR